MNDQFGGFLGSILAASAGMYALLGKFLGDQKKKQLERLEATLRSEENQSRFVAAYAQAMARILNDKSLPEAERVGMVVQLRIHQMLVTMSEERLIGIATEIRSITNEIEAERAVEKEKADAADAAKKSASVTATDDVSARRLLADHRGWEEDMKMLGGMAGDTTKPVEERMRYLLNFSNRLLGAKMAPFLDLLAERGFIQSEHNVSLVMTARVEQSLRDLITLPPHDAAENETPKG